MAFNPFRMPGKSKFLAKQERKVAKAGGFQIFGKTTRRLSRRKWGWADVGRGDRKSSRRGS